MPTGEIALRVVAADTVAGPIEVTGGQLLAAQPCAGAMLIRLAAPAAAAIVTVHLRPGAAFSFWARDVQTAGAILVRHLDAAVLPATDERSFAAVAAAVRAGGGQADMDRWRAEPEYTLEEAAAFTRRMECPTWLGLGRDMRIFRCHFDTPLDTFGKVCPCWHSLPVKLPGSDRPMEVCFNLGAGISPAPRVRRRLDDGVLPILTGTQDEGDVRYTVTAFATHEHGFPIGRDFRGSDWQASYACTNGQMLSADERAAIAGLVHAETQRADGELVCAVQVVAANHGVAPAYAWVRGACMGGRGLGWDDGVALMNGLGVALNVMDGKPFPQPELAVLLAPGEERTFTMYVPSRPLAPARVAKLLALDFDAELTACRAYWQAQLTRGAAISVPEPGIDERIRAGLLHLDVATIGKEAEGPLLATIGWYSPIGSESAPIIQFFDSMGWHGVAERCLDFFLARQRDNGFMQNFAGYELETGPALWTMGEHFRYTRDVDWVRRVRPHVDKACAYLLAWRERNKTAACRDAGCYGLLDGKVADPQDFYHSYFLNAVSYIGVARAAEMLAAVDPAAAAPLAAEAAAWREDIRAAFFRNLERAPVVPLKDGTWVPLVPPWTEHQADVSLCPDEQRWYTHGSFAGRSQMLGVLWLVIGEILDPAEPATTVILEGNETWARENGALSQPYYARHDYAHLRRGEVEAYLKCYYNQCLALQDRETYTFWEHYYGCSQHKTHEEGWFLMQTRWMLWVEEGAGLTLLKGIPRRWLAPGKEIRLDRVASHFGPISLVVSHQGDDVVADVTVEHQPEWIDLRLPSPECAQPRAVEGGTWNPNTETVRVDPGCRRVVVHY